jgi:citrate lyase subunit beta/citryl-CoA lyase
VPGAGDLQHARSLLFVPGDRPERFGKAALAGADAVVLDLEDAVAPGRKNQARDHVHRWLTQGNRVVVRINAPGTPWCEDDLAAVGPWASGVLVPKAEDPAEIEAVAAALPAGTAVLPLLETARGIVQATALCADPAVVRPVFGSVDLAVQLGVDHQSHDALRHARAAVVLAAATAGCAAPIDGVTTALGDERALAADLDHAALLGFTGKLCVHPQQVEPVNRRFTPEDHEIEWAHAVLAAGADGSVAVHQGQMVDRPVFLRAQAVLARRRKTG